MNIGIHIGAVQKVGRTNIPVCPRCLAGTRIFHVIEEIDCPMQRRLEDDLKEYGEIEEEQLECEGDCIECEGDCTGRIICLFQSKDRSRNDLRVVYKSSVDGEPGAERTEASEVLIAQLN